MEDIFGPKGLIARHHPAYEYRPQQIEMAKAIAEAVQDKRHLCVEAGTGTGKTLAYLIPALGCGQRVIISTGTKNLQEQLFFKDVPFIEKALGRKLSVCYMKGRSNYVCLEKLDRARKSPKLHGFSDNRALAQILDWARNTETGDRAELAQLSESLPIWKQLDARREACTGQKCPQFDDCFITRIRQEAAASDIIIINHHLFFADLALKEWAGGAVLPDYKVVIFDEAHELESIATHYFGTGISNYRIEELTRDIEQTLAGQKIGDRRINEALSILQMRSERFFTPLAQKEGRFRFQKSWAHDLEAAREAEAADAMLFAESPGAARRPRNGDDPAATAVDTQREAYLSLYNALRLVESTLAMIPEPTDETELLRERTIQIKSSLAITVESTDPSCVYWYEARGRGVFLHASPIDLAPILAERLFARVDTAVLTSATLATGGHFEFIRKRLGLEECRELILGSHFDYERQAIIYLPGRLADPRAHEFTEQAAEEIRKILEATRGRAFVLFTSYYQMMQIADRLREVLPFPLFTQGEMSRRGLLEAFKTTPNAVLFAVSSFWQGVDVQGEALSCVIIDKLPFTVPTDPLVAARMAYIEKQGGNPFYDYQVPEAIITLKQGLGRLIRSRRDRGVLSILDRRLVTRPYGRIFLQSLPKSRITDKISDLMDFLENTGGSRFAR